MKNKKADILWYILRLVLVIIVLFFLIFGLWKGFKGSESKFFGDKNTISLVIHQCNVACLSGIKKEYCEKPREVYSPDKSLAGMRTCKYLEILLDDLDCNNNNLKC